MLMNGKSYLILIVKLLIKHTHLDFQLEEMVDPSILVDVKVDKRGARIVVSGTSKNVLAAQDAIHKQCREYQKEKNTKIEADILYNQIRWHFEEITATEVKQIEYGKNPNLKIETAYKASKDSVELKDSEGKIYVVDFKDLVEYPKDDKTDKVRVIRKDILKGMVYFLHVIEKLLSGTLSNKIDV